MSDFNSDDIDAFLDEALIKMMTQPIAALYKGFKAEGLTRDEAAILAIAFFSASNRGEDSGSQG